MTWLKDFVEQVRCDPVLAVMDMALFALWVLYFVIGAYAVWLGLSGGWP